MRGLIFACLLMSAVCPAYAQSEDLATEQSEENMPYEENDSDIQEKSVDLLEKTMPDNTVVNVNNIQNIKNLPDEFVINLLQCSPDSISRVVDGVSEELTIIAPEGNKCRVKLAIFTLNIPNEMLSRLNSYEDFEGLISDPKIAALNYQDNYHFSGLATELSKCKGYSSIKHRGRSSSEYRFADMALISDMTAQHKKDYCELTFINNIATGGKFLNFNVICQVSDDKTDELIAPYSDKINLYNGEKENTDNTEVTDY